jgi:2-polyprenyl-3-methyl-5-hydroxy-6-metoxy-1,4-benzoquinol methylase
MMPSSCRICGSDLRHTFVDLGVSPLSNSFLRADQLDHMEPFYPLHVRVCEQCFLVQLGEFEKPENIFSDYAYFSSFSDSWLQHVRGFAESITKQLQLSPKSMVVEIASNDGYLLQYFVKAGIPVLGIEPARNVAGVAVEKGIRTLSRFFGESTAADLRVDGFSADLIIANNVLAHVPDVNGFVKGMKLLLKPQGMITIEFPHLLQLIEYNQFDTVYHEHFSYFSLISAEQLFGRHQLSIFDVEELSTHGGSLRLFVSHAENKKFRPSERLQRLRGKERAARLDRLATYGGFDRKVQKVKRDLLKFLIDAKSAGKSIVGYGAPAKGNTLLNYCGIGKEFLDYTVDLSPHKQGKFLPGTHIPIYSPQMLRETRPDYVLILPWNLKDEIVSQLNDIRVRGARFVIPIPALEVLE